MRTDIGAIKSDLAAAMGRRDAAMEQITNFRAELRRAEELVREADKSPAQHFQEERDRNTVNPLDELFV
jgi:prephenate dehydrogenase